MWNLIGVPTNADPFVETWSTKKGAVGRGAEILSWDGWDLELARKNLAKGSSCCMNGYGGSLQVVEQKKLFK